jgi:signal transduction histidine kinase
LARVEEAVNKPTVFLSYAREERVAARRLCESLRRRGVNVWFDEDSLIAGQDWLRTITAAIKKSDFFLPVMSDISVGKRGFVQREIREALNVVRTMPQGQIYMIPVRLNDCQPSFEELKNVQWVDIFNDWDRGIEEIVRAIEYSVGESIVDLSGFPTPFETQTEALAATYLSSHRGTTRVTGALHDVIATFDTYAQRRNLAVRLQDKTKGAAVPIDRQSLELLLSNLLHNALKYSYAPGEGTGWINVEGTAEGELVSITVENFGVPIESDEIDRGLIFMQGYRTRRSVGVPGAGIGLAVVRHIVDAVAGRIELASRAARKELPEHGDSSAAHITTITVWLPVVGRPILQRDEGNDSMKDDI